MKCQRAYARTESQKMGMLPLERTTPAPPFYHTGVDYAGPFYIRKGHTRRPVYVKSYVAVFVCFSTRAVHLELASDLSTQAFLSALQRFIARRGAPKVIHSDNGTNFVGAHDEIQEAQRMLRSKATQEALLQQCQRDNIEWQFIPPAAPHFGGLWESAVRIMKTQLIKLIGKAKLTYEELNTILTTGEAILNSRPIVPLDKTDKEFSLMAGHFLIGRPLRALPPILKSKGGPLTLRRWNLVRKLQEELWIKWKAHYLPF